MSTTHVASVLDLLPQDGCVLWPGVIGRDGYGLSSVNRRRMVAHRRVYLVAVGSIPDGMQLDHLCRVRLCVNPAHLEPVTPRENTARARELVAVADPRTHCVSGHRMDDGNTYIRPDGSGKDCRTCIRARVAAYKSRRVLASAS